MPDGGPVTIGGVDGLGRDDGPIFAVIGVFDGIHRGHQYLLRHLDLQAEAHHARPTVITFDAHPDEVILGAAPPLLLDPEERLRLLGEAGVEVVVVQHFDAALRATEYDDFLERITARTRLAGLLMTPDAAFGHDRRGTPETVAALGASQGFDLVVRPPFLIDGRPGPQLGHPGGDRGRGPRRGGAPPRPAVCRDRDPRRRRPGLVRDAGRAAAGRIAPRLRERRRGRRRRATGDPDRRHGGLDARSGAAGRLADADHVRRWLIGPFARSGPALLPSAGH